MKPTILRRLLWVTVFWLWLVSPHAVWADGSQHDDETDKGTSREVALLRVTSDIKYLASDELGGRLPGSPEMETCVKYITDEFKRIGLKPAMPDGTYLQPLDVSRQFGSNRTLKSESCQLTLVGPNGKSTSLKLDEDYRPQLNLEDIELNTGLVFVGYGIRSAEHNFDEYKDIDVKGKIVILIRVEPQQTNPDSVFDGKVNSLHARILSKVAAAKDAGAVGILLVNDGVTAPNAERDELAASDMFGNVTSTIPFAHVKRAALESFLADAPIVKADGAKLTKLSEIEKLIDDELTPLSQEFKDCSARFTAQYDQRSVLTSNIIGVIEGEGPHANETIVIGGHYDHLGKGAYGSRAPGRNEIHNGADDNATGTAGIMELARRFMKSEKKPARRLVFICFTAEEMGLVGAQHYVENPVFPLENTVAMVNYDMIGWLRNNQLTVYSWYTGDSFSGALVRANQNHKLNLVKPAGAFAGSDHLPFMQRNIPVMFLHTGITNTYHTPEDDFETINCDGALKVIEFTESLIVELANLPERPKFSSAPVNAPRNLLGVSATESEGKVTVRSVSQDSLAAKIGLQPEDIILTIADEEVTARRQITRLLSANAGKTIKMKIRRGEEEIQLEFKVESVGQ